MWMYNYYLKSAIQLGNNDIYRKFGQEETQFTTYLNGLFPLVSITISLMVFNAVKTYKKINERVLKLITYIIYGFILYYLFYIFSIIIGSSQFNFINGRLAEGNRVFCGYEEATFLLLLVGLKFFLSKFKVIPLNSWLNATLNIIIAIISILILLGIKKGTLLSLGNFICSIYFS
ncbi:MAG: hypothetical protein MZU84_03720 [Sphingobacterium sp.]|nr:hypothetical protein [Sphingobacterium sp.]